MNNLQALKKVETEIAKTRKIQEEKVAERAKLTKELDQDIAACQSKLRELNAMKKIIDMNIKREEEAAERLAEILGISSKRGKKNVAKEEDDDIPVVGTELLEDEPEPEPVAEEPEPATELDTVVEEETPVLDDEEAELERLLAEEEAEAAKATEATEPSRKKWF